VPFVNSCFISYSSGDGELMETFISQVKDAFTSSLGPYLRHMPVYLDKTRLAPGTFFNVALARNICESICMIVIYSPSYRESLYCRAEFETMRRVELERLQAIGKEHREAGMIIPILLRGSRNEMPAEIRSRQILDFSKFTTADRRITKNRRYVGRIDEAAEYIWSVHEALVSSGAHRAEGCEKTELPPDDEIPDWGGATPPALPGREPGK
jgi:hypothetical protein